MTPDVKASMGQFNLTSTSRPEEIATYLQELRKALDAGQIDVGTYAKQGQALATEAFKRAHQIAGTGSKAASTMTPVIGVIEAAGFMDQTSTSKQARINLPQEYQEKIRDSLLPSNITGTERERLLKEIPDDIELGSDRYALEREGIRQKVQQETTAAEQKTGRRKLLDDLSGLLTERTKNQFNDAVPEIAEQANVGGVFRSTGLGNALAKERARLERDASTTLAGKAIEYGETDVDTLSSILSNQQGFQSAGLSRDFSLDDYARQAAFAREMAALAQPSPKGKGTGDKVREIASVAVPIGKEAIKAGMSGGGGGGGK